MRQSSVTQKGQVTIPADIRAKLGLKHRDKVTFELEADAVRIRPSVSRVLAGYGSVKPRSRPEGYKKLRREFEEGVAEDVMSETAD